MYRNREMEIVKILDRIEKTFLWHTFIQNQLHTLSDGIEFAK